MPHMKRTVKDSVFTYLFQDPQYTLQLYKSLHAEDDGVEEKDIEVITLTNVLVDDIYNDLGFLVKDRLIILVEAQSTFSPNLPMRMLFYLAATYKAYSDEKLWSLHAAKAYSFPKMELYVIYTGKGDVPDRLRLSDLCGGDEFAELKVKVLLGTAADKNDIVRQYVRFCKIADEERRKGGPTVETVKRIIDRCIEEGVLPIFLASRRREVENIMVVLYDEAKAREIYEYNVRKDALEEGREEGRAEGRNEGTEKGISAMVATLKQLAIEKAVAKDKLVLNFHLSPQVAEAKVEQYWN